MSDTRVNPFAQDLVNKLPPPTTLVIFGAGGDLSRKKLLPAIYNLGVRGQLPANFSLVGIGLGIDANQFRNVIQDSLTNFSRTQLSPESWSKLSDNIHFIHGDFSSDETFKQVKSTLDDLDKTKGVTEKVFYLATAPQFFATIAQNLGGIKLGKSAETQTKLVIEKPFGHNYLSAKQLNETINSCFDEKQIYRIDHYLGKETVQNLLVWRFANGIFEPIWNRRYVDHIQITVAESIGIEGRASYYEKSGAIRDIVQNHMMQLVALIGMEPPVTFSADVIRDEKVKLLESIKIPGVADVPKIAVRGQYEAGWVDGQKVIGYREEDDVDPQSMTNTFIAMKLQIDNWRWAGTPFYLRTGKRMGERATQVVVHFKPAPHLAFDPSQSTIEPNKLVLSIQPDEGATMQIMAKVPGSSMALRPVRMDFQYGASFLSASPEAYERLLHDVLINEATLFTRSDEVEAAWSIIDPLLVAWQQNDGRLYFYPAGSDGPTAADALIETDGRHWEKL